MNQGMNKELATQFVVQSFYKFPISRSFNQWPSQYFSHLANQPFYQTSATDKPYDRWCLSNPWSESPRIATGTPRKAGGMEIVHTYTHILEAELGYSGWGSRGSSSSTSSKSPHSQYLGSSPPSDLQAQNKPWSPRWRWHNRYTGSADINFRFSLLPPHHHH